MTDDQDLRDVMADEASRGTRRPHRGLNQKRLRALRQAADMLADEDASWHDYAKVLRDGLGLQENSAEWRSFVKVWNDRHGAL